MVNGDNGGVANVVACKFGGKCWHDKWFKVGHAEKMNSKLESTAIF